MYVLLYFDTVYTYRLCALAYVHAVGIEFVCYGRAYGKSENILRFRKEFCESVCYARMYGFRMFEPWV